MVGQKSKLDLGKVFDCLADDKNKDISLQICDLDFKSQEQSKQGQRQDQDKNGCTFNVGRPDETNDCFNQDMTSGLINCQTQTQTNNFCQCSYSFQNNHQRDQNYWYSTRQEGCGLVDTVCKGSQQNCTQQQCKGHGQSHNNFNSRSSTIRHCTQQVRKQDYMEDCIQQWKVNCVVSTNIVLDHQKQGTIQRFMQYTPPSCNNFTFMSSGQSHRNQSGDQEIEDDVVDSEVEGKDRIDHELFHRRSDREQVHKKVNVVGYSQTPSSPEPFWEGPRLRRIVGSVPVAEGKRIP